MNEDVAIPTLRQIRAAMAAGGSAPTRRFGQNFLTDAALLQRIVADAEVGEGDLVLEVGPGPGALTAALLRAGGRVVAVEIDAAMIAVLQQLVGAHPRLSVLQDDILAERPAPSAAVRERLRDWGQAGDPPRFTLVANLPYQVASTLLVDLWWHHPPRRAMVTIQREVAERLAARPGTEAYGPLAVMMQLRASVTITRRLAPGAFWPAPKVESACVRLDPIATDPRLQRINSGALSRTAHGVFHARRKQVLNSLQLAFPELTGEQLAAALAAAGIGATRRGEELGRDEILELALAMSPSVASRPSPGAHPFG